MPDNKDTSAPTHIFSEHSYKPLSTHKLIGKSKININNDDDLNRLHTTSTTLIIIK